MNDTQFERNLQSVGLALFVEFYNDFADENKSTPDVVEMVFQTNGYPEQE